MRDDDFYGLLVFFAWLILMVCILLISFPKP